METARRSVKRLLRLTEDLLERLMSGEVPLRRRECDASDMSRFDRYAQVQPSAGALGGGVGVEPAICRSITEQPGGRIRVESELGMESSFFVVLPTRTSERSPAIKGI